MKPGTFTQIYVQLVFAVKNRETALRKQEGYGAFSYSRSQISNIYKYIENQEETHKFKTFQDEYVQYLKKREMEFDEQFLYEFWENPV